MKGKTKRIFASLIAFVLLASLLAFFAACGEEQEPGPDVPGDATVVELTVDTPPDVTEYYIGETFDPTGMKIKARWSDGVKLPVNIAECTIDPSGPLEAGDREVTISYGGQSVTLPITLKNDSVSSVSVDTGNIALKAAVGTPMDFSGITVTVHYADGGSRVVSGGYTFEVDGEPVEDVSALTFDKWGTHTLTVVYGTLRTDISLEIFDGFVVEAENMLGSGEVTEDTKNYVEISRASASGSPSVIRKENEPASGGAYMGSVFNGSVIRFHVWAEEACYADVILRASSAYMLEDGGAWSPIEMGDQQFNRLFDVAYGSAEDAASGSMTELYVEDDVILEGGKTDNQGGDPMLYVNWKDVNFGTLPLEQGDNIIELSVVTDYINCHGENVACNIDRLEVQYTDDYVPPATVDTLTIKKAPDKTTYKAGESFDPTGMVVEAAMSDDTTHTVDTDDLTITPSGALGAEDESVTITYRGASVEQPVTVLTAKFLEITHAPTKTEYKSGETFDPTGMTVTAVLSDDSTYEPSLDELTITPSGALSMADIKVTVSYLGASVDQAITVAAAETLTIEGENIKSPDDGEHNYVEAVRNGYQGGVGAGATEAPGEADTSGGYYLNGLFGATADKPGAIARFHVWSDTAATATIKIYVSSCNVITSGDGNPWHPSEMGDVQFNDVFAVRVGSNADALEPVAIGDDVIVEGGKTDDGSVSMALWENWREITLGTFDLAAGDNIVELENINSELTNLAGEIYGMNVDKLVVEFA